MNIATKHTTKRCKYCKTPMFIGCAFWWLGNNKYICERCNNLAVAYITIKLIKLENKNGEANRKI